MIGRCKDCRHWKKMPYSRSGDPKRECSNDKNCDWDDKHPDGAYANSNEPCVGGTLETGPEFGCVNFECSERTPSLEFKAAGMAMTSEAADAMDMLRKTIIGHAGAQVLDFQRAQQQFSPVGPGDTKPSRDGLGSAAGGPEMACPQSTGPFTD